MRSAEGNVSTRSADGMGDRSLTPPPGPKRLLSSVGELGIPVGLDQHLETWGPLPAWKGSSFIDELDRSGLRGHGGGWFPVGTKWRSVRGTGFKRAVVEIGRAHV